MIRGLFVLALLAVTAAASYLTYKVYFERVNAKTREAEQLSQLHLATVEALNLTPPQVMMVAAHSDDLRSAASNGLRTAHVARPGEYGPGTGEDGPKVPVDIAAHSLEDLAGKLGA